MIAESEYWKKPLLAAGKRLRRFKSAQRLSNRSLVQIERDVFLRFYSIRKLFDTLKVTDAIKAAEVRISSHANVKPATWRNRDDIASCYDLGAAVQEARPIRFICNKFIHSFVFVPRVGERGGLDGLYFTSDQEKDRKLFLIDIDSVIEIFERVGENYPVAMEWRRDPKTGADTIKLS
jgi:hypothetical protein